MSTVFVVTKQAVYPHGIAGVFSTLDAAKACADDLACSDVDSHHRYTVTPYEVDVHTPLGGVNYWPGRYIVDPESVYEVSKT